MMRKIVFSFFFLIFFLQPFSTDAQTATPSIATAQLIKEQESTLRYIGSITIDSNIIFRLSVFIEMEVDSIQHFIVSDTTFPDSEKERAIQSMIYFMTGLCNDLALKKIEIYDIPDVLKSYKQLLNALLYHTPIVELMAPLGPSLSQLLANTFWQYEECALLNDIATYKRVISSPGYIYQFLEKNNSFRFTDSLILFATAQDPLKMISIMLQHKQSPRYFTSNKKNIYLQQVAALSEDRSVSELIPFIVPLAEKKITSEEILKKRTDVTSYFQLLVNTLKEELSGLPDSSFIFRTALRNGIKEKSLSFYVNRINELHSAAYDIRFAAIKDLRVEDIYYIITSCEEELYTSSYLGLYRHLMEYFRFQPADSIFRIVQYDNFRTFIRMAANYNTLADFLSCMPQENAKALLKRFISGIETNTDSGLGNAMDVADCFAGLTSIAELSNIIQDELQSNLERCESGKLYFGIRLYNILLEVFGLVRQKDPVNKHWTHLGNSDMIQRNSLQDKNGEIIQLVLFYGDEDGVSSFNNFLELFIDSCKWHISKNNFWVTIRSLGDQPIIIYANLPLDNKEGMDLQAQDSLCIFLKQQSVEPVILIHRGHSYHITQTLRRLQPSVKLTILGSCGGYNNILSIANITPDAQIIVSKKTGSMLINDPMIAVITETLNNKKDIIWTEVWEELTIRFGKNEFLLNLFNEYIPPTKNVSLFVLKLFNYYR